jgi:3-phenylpropionate/cinnamic acid dioxygenase small subunit
MGHNFTTQQFYNNNNNNNNISSSLSQDKKTLSPRINITKSPESNYKPQSRTLHNMTNWQR